jgi:NAD(P)-dependent dehydrogenase (short-subunit alcohol dehydrogenase family)
LSKPSLFSLQAPNDRTLPDRPDRPRHRRQPRHRRRRRRGAGAPGAHVVLTARTAADLEQAEERIHQAGGTATIAPLDLIETDSIARLAAAVAERWGRLDLLMLNAATLGSLTPVAQIDGKEFSRVLTLNLLAAQALIAAFDPLLRKSEAGRCSPSPPASAAIPGPIGAPTERPKAALETLALSYGEEVRNLSPVRVAVVDPGATATVMRAPRVSRRGPGDPQAARRRGGRGGGAAPARLRDRGAAGGSRLGKQGASTGSARTGGARRLNQIRSG